MLYGHIETFEHRVDHMERLRQLQDRTHGFNAFIPLKFRNKENEMSHVPEVSVVEDLRNYAIAGFTSIILTYKSLLAMIVNGPQHSATLSTSVPTIWMVPLTIPRKIYSMAGAEEQTQN